MIESKKSSFIKSALVLSAGGIIAKILGAIYRIPLTNMLGSYGIGVYQLVFPMYTLLLTISSCGIPVAISKLVSEKLQLNKPNEAQHIFKTSLFFLTIFGIAGSLLLFFLSDSISGIQGNMEASLGYKVLSPSILFVCVISAFRGYFQGRLNMTPTAISQIVEQVVKMTLGIVLVYINLPNIMVGVTYAIVAVSASELAALIILSIQYYFYKGKIRYIYNGESTKATLKSIVMLSIPITLSGLIIPLTQLIDSVLVINLTNVVNATSLYGLWTGPVHSLLNMPIVLTLGIATAILPSISKARAAKNIEEVAAKTRSAIKLTFIVALPCTIGVIVLARPILELLYGGLTKSEIDVSTLLLQISGVSILFLSILQTCTAVLQGKGHMYKPVKFLILSTVIKTVLNLILIPIPSINIYGAGISSVVCYFVAGFLDLLYIYKGQKIKLKLIDMTLKPIICCGVMSLVIFVFLTFFNKFVYTVYGTLLVVMFAMISYIVCLFTFKVFDENELNSVGFLKKINKIFNRK